MRVMREGVDLVEQGVIDPEGLDTCVSWGIGYKLAVVGPMALLDMAGLDIYQAVGSYLNKDLCSRGDVASYVTARTACWQAGHEDRRRHLQLHAGEDHASCARSGRARLVAVRKALDELGGDEHRRRDSLESLRTTRWPEHEDASDKQERNAIGSLIMTRTMTIEVICCERAGALALAMAVGWPAAPAPPMSKSSPSWCRSRAPTTAGTSRAIDAAQGGRGEIRPRVHAGRGPGLRRRASDAARAGRTTAPA